jgi:subtilase family serine protease
MIGKKAWGGLKPLNRICRCRWIAVCTVVVAMAASLAAQTLERPGRITQEIDSTRVIPLRGNVRADVAAAPDLGPVEDELPLRLYMVLKRSPEQQAELDNLLARQQQPTAPEYHRWLTPQEFGARFGASPSDIAKITRWLESRGLRVNGAMNNHMFIDFSATAGQVREVFGTQLHYFNIQGGKHAATPADPMIPAALAPVVSGIKGLNKIPPKALHTKPRHASYDAATHHWQRVEAEGSAAVKPFYNDGSGSYFVSPQDYYTIYNVNPVFTGNGNLGAGAAIAVIEESDIAYGTVDPSTGAATGGDVATFRSLFGVPGTLNMHVYHGYGTGTTAVSCSAPGIDPLNIGEDIEAALDAEWANALAPAANLIFMSCDNVTDNGIFTSMLALIDNSLADAMSLSYGNSELYFATSDYAAFDTMYTQAAAQGQTIIISSGDSGSDVADQNAEPPCPSCKPPLPATTSYCPNPIVDTTGTAVCGLNVNAFASSPNVTSAGGTDFSDLYDALDSGVPQTAYWGANSPHYGDALGYIPETAWNGSCSSSILAHYFGYINGATLCATAVLPFGIGNNPFIQGEVVGGSGGFSTHYTVPSYQSAITGYSGTMRAQPDISGYASNGGVDGFWNHALIFCDSYLGSYPCTSTSNFGLAGGTSFVAPSLAGVTGLLVTSTGSRQGLLNPALYALAKAQFTASATKTACYSNGQATNTGVTPSLASLPNSSTCIFNDVTTGNNDVPCAAGSTNCYVNSGASYGMLSLGGAGSLKAAYPSTIGYDEATGIGTLNVYNLITKWNTVFPSTTALAANPTTIAATQSTTLTATVTTGVPAGSTYTPPVNGMVNFVAGATALGSCTVSGGSCTLQVNGSALQPGANSIAATFVSESYATSTSSLVTVTVGPILKTQTITFPTPPTQTYGVGSITLTATGGGSGNPVTYAVLSGPGTVSGSTLTITGAGSIVVQASQAGNSSYAAATPVDATVTVLPRPLTVVANNQAVAKGAAIPTLTGTLTGALAGDGITATYTTTALNSLTVGIYPITPVLAPNSKLVNYSVTITNGALEIYYNSTLPLALLMSPGSATAGGPSFTLTLTGGNFNSKSVVLWNGAARATTYVSGAQLKATILASDIAAAGIGMVTVANPAPNAGTSSAQAFVVLSSSPVPIILGASLSDTANASGNYVLVLMGSNFLPGSTVTWNSLPLTPTYISGSEIAVVLTATEYASPGVVTVTNPSGTSNAFEVQ